MPRSTTASIRSTTRSAKVSSSSTSSRMRQGSSSQPSHFPSSRPVQTAGSRAQMRSTISALMRAPSSLRPYRPGSRSRQRAALLADAVDDLVERVGELLHALLLERVGHVVVVHACGGELLEELARVADSLEHRVAAHLAVLLERVDRLERHRVHRLRPDELLDV